MTDTSPDKGIDKKCKRCSKSRIEGAIFGNRKVTTNSIPSFYEKLTCNFCEALDAKQRRQDVPDKIAENKQRYREKHHGTIKYHVQEKIATWRKASNVPSDLTVDYLISIYEKQGGYCFYSGKKMIFGWVNGKVHHDSLSLDKLDPTKGYVQGNVVWCTYLINTMKQNMTEHQFYDVINSIYDTTYGIPMLNEISLRDKLRKITTQAKLGDLPKMLEKACIEDAELGKTSCVRCFHDSPGTLLPFYTAMGPANIVLWKKVRQRINNDTGMTMDGFDDLLIKDLIDETGLKIQKIPQDNNHTDGLHNIGLWQNGVSMALKIDWS